MDGDTFSRIEERMEEFHRVPHRASAQFADREHADRVAEQIANERNVSPLAMLSGVPQEEAIVAFAESFMREKRKQCTGDAEFSRDAAFASIVDQLADAESSIAERDQRIAHLERELADLRAAQQPADPVGAHPYRSALSIATAAPGRPVTASGAAERVDGRSGAIQRVYGALGGGVADACMALTPVLGGVSVYVMCSAAGADTFGAVLGMALSGLAIALIAKGDAV